MYVYIYTDIGDIKFNPKHNVLIIQAITFFIIYSVPHRYNVFFPISTITWILLQQRATKKYIHITITARTIGINNDIYNTSGILVKKSLPKNKKAAYKIDIIPAV